RDRDRVRAGLVALAAARLVLLGCSDDDRVAGIRSRQTVDEPLCRRRRTAAAVADGLELVDELGVGEQLRHRADGQPAEVLIEPCGDDPRTAVGERQRRTDDARFEELHLVDADHLMPGGARDELGHAPDGYAAHAYAGV